MSEPPATGPAAPGAAALAPAPASPAPLPGTAPAAPRRRAPSITMLRRYFAGPVLGRRWAGRALPTPPTPLTSSAAASPAASAPGEREGLFARQRRQFTTAQVIVRCFYAFVLYYAVTQCPEYPNLITRMNFVPLWPVGWMSFVSGPRAAAIAAVIIFYTLGSVAGAFFASQRWARVVVFTGMLEYFALRNSFGKIGHSTHLFVMTAFLLIFLPAGWQRPAALASRRTRQETLLAFWLAQAALLLSYTMSGLDKLGGAVYQIAVGETSAFSPGALGAHIAHRLVQTSSHSLLGSFIIWHPWLTWPLMPFPVYLEVFAFWIAFRPALQRWWALALILFHLGTIFTLTITFPVACLLLALFFFQSPFQPTTVRWREMLAGVPLVSELLNLLTIIRRTRESRRARKAPRDNPISIVPVS